jgi:peroxiredoxin
MSKSFEIIERVGISTTSSSEAIKSVVKEANDENRVGWFEVIEERGRVMEDGEIEFQVTVKIGRKLNYLTEVNMSLKVGDVAPDFTLKNHDLADVSLSDFKGKNVVLLFFPFVNTAVCEKELCSFRDGLSQYEELDAQVLAVSVDSPFSQKLWVDKHNFSFPLLSDFNKEVSKNMIASSMFLCPVNLIMRE